MLTPADAVEYPVSLLREQASRWALLRQLVSPGGTSAGRFPRLSLDGGGAWACDIASVNLRTAAHVKTWRVIDSRAQGGVAPVVVPMCDKRHMTFPVIGGQTVYSHPAVPHIDEDDDETFFSDGTGYATPAVQAYVSGTRLLRATRIVIVFHAGGPLKGGEYFSLRHAVQGWRLYRVNRVLGDGEVQFDPPLREAIGNGAWVEFNHPRCTMRLRNPDGMAAELALRRFANPSVSFVETFF